MMHPMKTPKKMAKGGAAKAPMTKKPVIAIMILVLVSPKKIWLKAAWLKRVSKKQCI